jgi:hypothetical protein
VVYVFGRKADAVYVFGRKADAVPDRSISKGSCV